MKLSAVQFLSGVILGGIGVDTITPTVAAKYKMEMELGQAWVVIKMGENRWAVPLSQVKVVQLANPADKQELLQNQERKGK